MIPFNKGKKGLTGRNKTSFKKGCKSITEKPVGSQRVDERSGYVYIKIENGKPWKLKHHIIWEKHNGKIPDNHIIIFKNQNTSDCSLENLECIPKSIHARMNKNKRYQSSDVEASLLISKIEDKISQRKG